MTGMHTACLDSAVADVAWAAVIGKVAENKTVARSAMRFMIFSQLVRVHANRASCPAEVE